MYGVALPASVGIIGGADGPTVIYITGSFSPWLAVAAVLGLAALAAALIFWKKRRK